ncbi:shikimate dehydrogenase [Alkalihalobacillus sp. MEB130]|uniref:shikimate dehydrogenase n=1 Tax=Alkalihalobacillus sp. MEB130 TaxID=2976704 RepID=UPI0028DDBB8C|nr:shikimate dehydrogenase [Alkalihalobacillus sp. MEB130]MDT8861441.1 shikimate dehydrogenase [Alkalihalobacillus sp. MEB130]
MGKVFGLLGHPVGHSMSPQIHNDAFNKEGIEAVYHAFDVKPELVREAISGLRALQIAGCNVTVPHKLAVMEFLDEIDEEARLIGAVNTIVNQDGKLIGYNTDGRGYVQSLLEEMNSDIKDKRILIIGAGGAARGVLTALLQHGIAHVAITNRTLEKANSFLALANNFSISAEAIDRIDAEERLHEFDVVINTTSVGMSPHIHETPLSLTKLRKESVVSDLIYNPLETTFLKEAKSQGALIINGVGMFVNQAALSFEYWTGKKPDREQMKKIVLQQLGGTTC